MYMNLDVPRYANKLIGNDSCVLKLRSGITELVSVKSYDKEEMIAEFVEKVRASDAAVLANYPSVDFTSMTDTDVALWYNDNVIYPDKVRLNCYYYRNYSFIKDIQMIFATVLGKRIEYAGERI